MSKKTIFSNYEHRNKKFDHNTNIYKGPFMSEFGEDIISEVVQNEIHVKNKKKKINNDSKSQNNSSKN